jgi:hypothetical protein
MSTGEIAPGIGPTWRAAALPPSAAWAYSVGVVWKTGQQISMRPSLR